LYFATLLKTTAPVKLPISQLSLFLGKHKPNFNYKVPNICLISIALRKLLSIDFPIHSELKLF